MHFVIAAAVFVWNIVHDIRSHVTFSHVRNLSAHRCCYTTRAWVFLAKLGTRGIKAALVVEEAEAYLLSIGDVARTADSQCRPAMLVHSPLEVLPSASWAVVCRTAG
jgi:hypothetical protein